MKEAWGTSDNRAAALVEFFGRLSVEQADAVRDALRVVQLNGVRIDSPAQQAGSPER
jgi:hypothetical protein